MRWNSVKLGNRILKPLKKQRELNPVIEAEAGAGNCSFFFKEEEEEFGFRFYFLFLLSFCCRESAVGSESSAAGWVWNEKSEWNEKRQKKLRRKKEDEERERERRWNRSFNFRPRSGANDPLPRSLIGRRGDQSATTSTNQRRCGPGSGEPRRSKRLPR